MCAAAARGPTGLCVCSNPDALIIGVAATPRLNDAYYHSPVKAYEGEGSLAGRGR